MIKCCRYVGKHVGCNRYGICILCLTVNGKYENKQFREINVTKQRTCAMTCKWKI